MTIISFSFLLPNAVNLIIAAASTKMCTRKHKLQDKRAFLQSCVQFFAHSFLKPGQSRNPCETVQVFRCCCEMIAGGYVGPISVFKVTGEFLLCSQLTQSAHMAEGPSSTELIRLSGSIGLTYRWSDLRMPTVFRAVIYHHALAICPAKTTFNHFHSLDYIIIISADIFSTPKEMCFCSLRLREVKRGQVNAGSPLIMVSLAGSVKKRCETVRLKVLRVLWAQTASILKHQFVQEQSESLAWKPCHCHICVIGTF